MNNVMVSLKDGFSVWRQIQKENFSSIIVNVWLSMMSDHGANPTFFIKNKDLIFRTLAYPPPPVSAHSSFLPYPPPPVSDNTSFLPYPLPHLKVDVICVSPLIKKMLKNTYFEKHMRTDISASTPWSEESDPGVYITDLEILEALNSK